MKIALIGHGVMGQLIEGIAINKGHEISSIIGGENSHIGVAEVAKILAGADVAIDFSVAESIERNTKAACEAKIPLVVGTTGWNSQIQRLQEIVDAEQGAFLYGSNFSVGMNLFFRISEYASEIVSKFAEYEAFIEEQHHSRKVDSPSGTAIRLKELVENTMDCEIDVAATRVGNIPGTHRVGFDGTADQILLEHTARTREGFAVGAIFSAEWIVGKQGFWDFSEVIDEIL